MKRLLILLIGIALTSSCVINNLHKEESIGWFNSKSMEDVLCAFDVPAEKMNEGDLEIWIYDLSRKARREKKERFRGADSKEFFTKHPSIQKYDQQLTFVFKDGEAYVWHVKGFELMIIENKKSPLK
jgi:hypothetical protein